jgi:hypothetical protein
MGNGVVAVHWRVGLCLFSTVFLLWLSRVVLVGT